MAAPRHPQILAALAGLVAACSSPLLAQPMGRGMMPQDPYGDATVARTDAEAQASARFAAMDSNADGVLSAAEMRAARPARPAGARPGGEGPGNDAERPGGRGGGMDGMLRMLDNDGDGKLTRAEFVAGSLRRFDMADANHDGQLTKAERQAAMEEMRARMEERMRAMMAGGMGGNGD